MASASLSNLKARVGARSANKYGLADPDVLADMADTMFEGRTLSAGTITLGDGGTVTQGTSTTTGVTLSTMSGQITTFSSTLAAGGEETFTVTNTNVAATSVVVVCIASTASAGTPVAVCSAVAAGTFDITITNLHASAALDDTSVVNFGVFGGSAT